MNGSRVADGALGGADINEGSLAQVPSAAAIGGVPAAQIARTDPGASPTPTPYVTKGAIDITSAASLLDLGFVTLAGNGTGIRICSQSSSIMRLMFFRNYGLQAGAFQSLMLGNCVNFATNEAEVITIAFDNGTDAVYATLVNPGSDVVYNLWALS